MSLLITLLMLAQPESGARQEVRDPAYACVPAAGAVVLRRFGLPGRYAELYREMNVRDDGTASLADLRRACESRGLHVAVYQYLTIPQLRTYLTHGYCAVIVMKTEEAEQHAACYFGDPPLECDLLHPVRVADPDSLREQLQSGVYSIIVGKQPVPPPLIDLSTFAAVTAATGVLVYLAAGVSLRYYRRRVNFLERHRTSTC